MSITRSPATRSKDKKSQQEAETEEERAVRRPLGDMDRDAANIVDLRRELEILRTELNAQRNLVSELSIEERRNNGVNTPSIDVGGESLLASLVEHLQGTRIDILTPKFSDSYQTNPLRFLDDVDRFFRAKSIRDDRKLAVIESCLSGRARTWFVINRNNFERYENFVRAFSDEFYTVPVQVNIRNRWRDRRYHVADGSLTTYFFNQVKAAQYIGPRMLTYELNYCIVQQLPSRVRDILSVVDFSNTTLITQALEQFDHSNGQGGERGRDRDDGTRRGEDSRRNVRRVDRVRVVSNRRSNYDYNYENVNRGRSSGDWMRRDDSRSRCQSDVYNDVLDADGGTEFVRLPDTRFPPPNLRDVSTRDRPSGGMQYGRSLNGRSVRCD